MEKKIGRLQGEMNPAALKANAPMTRPPQEIRAQGGLDVGHDARFELWVEPVAAEVAMHAFEHEAARIAAHPIAGLYDFGIGKPIAREPQRRAKSGRSCAQDRNLGPAPILCDGPRSSDLANIIHGGLAAGSPALQAQARCRKGRGWRRRLGLLQKGSSAKEVRSR